MLLTAQRGSNVRISDIALQSGFSDISYFNRLFRSRFGDTPSGVRGASPPTIAKLPELLKRRRDGLDTDEAGGATPGFPA